MRGVNDPKSVCTKDLQSPTQSSNGCVVGVGCEGLSGEIVPTSKE